jgi:hypothetical protein
MLRALAVSLRIELRDGVEDREARVGGAFGVVVAGLWPPKESHHSVADKLRHVVVEARNRGGGRPMEAGESLAPLLGIQLSRDGGERPPIKRYYSQMAARVARSDSRSVSCKVAKNR